jgi:hypothetical protein
MIEERARKDAARLDAATEKGRKAIGSLVYKIRRLKTSGDDAGKELKADYLAKITPIDAERRIWRERMDALAEEIDRPVAEFKAREAQYIAGQEAALAELAAFGRDIPASSAAIDSRLAELDSSPLLVREWKSYRERAQETVQNAFNTLKVARVEAVERENAAEAARLEAARLQAQREAEIARQAAESARLAAEKAAAVEAARVAQEAETARLAAEAVAQAERDRIEREAREAAEAAETERLRLVREAEEAEAAAAAELAAAAQRERAALDKAERRRVEGHRLALQSIKGIIADACSPFNGSDMIHHIVTIMDGMPEITRDFEEFSEEAETLIVEGRERIAARLAAVKVNEEQNRQKRAAADAQKAEAARLAEEKRIADAAEAAAQRERKRAADERAEAERQEAIRQADKVHRGKINRDVLTDLVALGLSDEHGRAVVAALVKKTIRHVTIAY